VAGDYVVIPRGTIHRWLPADGATALTVAAGGHIRPPRRYLSQYGQFLEHAPYSERDLRGPDGPLLAEGEDVPVACGPGPG
jgi:Homogentisate 1,2-dioxygenase